jgi:hypothetical protein
MAWYRFYHLGSDGQLVVPEDYAAADDLCALRKARTMTNAHGAELWRGPRKIADVPPKTREPHIGRPVMLFGNHRWG